MRRHPQTVTNAPLSQPAVFAIMQFQEPEK